MIIKNNNDNIYYLTEEVILNYVKNNDESIIENFLNEDSYYSSSGGKRYLDDLKEIIKREKIYDDMKKRPKPKTEEEKEKQSKLPSLTKRQIKDLDFKNRVEKYQMKADSTNNYFKNYKNRFKSAYYASRATDNTPLKSILRAERNTGYKISKSLATAGSAYVLIKKLNSLYKLKNSYNSKLKNSYYKDKNMIQKVIIKIQELINKIRNRLSNKNDSKSILRRYYK